MPAFRDTLRAAWALVHLSQAHLATLEARASTLLEVIIAGMIATWATIHNFDPGATRTVVYVAWGIVVLSVFIHGWIVLPRREHALAPMLAPGHVFAEGKPIELSDECELAVVLSAGIRSETERLQRGMRWSVGLNLLALTLIACAYLVESI
jgi:hypothetical protein